MFVVKRSEHNPIISPHKDASFEAFAAFNGSPVKVGSVYKLLYRAQSLPETFEQGTFSLSSIGIATSKDGVHFTDKKQFIEPTEVWERYGCEDPRVTKIGGEYFCFYTALSVYPFRAEGIKVGVALSKDLKKVTEKHLVTPFNAKAMSLFSEKIGGKYVAILTVNTDLPPASVALAYFDKKEDMWSPAFWKRWYANLPKHTLTIPKKDTDHLEIGSAPLKTKYGWLLVYSHIQDYMTDHKIFGIEAVLLDLKDPRKVIGKTRGPLLIPQESYEQFGLVPNVIFPSGALLQKEEGVEMLSIYYGATDTTVALAKVPLKPLVDSMKLPHGEVGFQRLTDGPLFVPREDVAWEKKAVFNPASLYVGGKMHILYRAMSDDNTSTIGYVQSKDGTSITYQSDKPVYVPREPFESKRVPGGNSGCEDPRLTMIGETIYMYYTAYNGVSAPAIAETHITKKDFLDKKWTWSKPVLVSRDGVDDKDGCLHPEKIGDKYFLYHRVSGMICGDYGKTPYFTERNNFKNIPIILPRKGMWDGLKVGISAPPLKTKYGWLLIYHGVSADGVYRVGAALLDQKDPTVVLSRSTDYLFAPLLNYEKQGIVNNVVFPCGASAIGDTLFIYYGGGDRVVDVAAMSLSALIQSLR